MRNTLIIKIFAFYLLTNISSVKAQNKTNINNNIKNLIEKKRTFNKEIGYGYCIQIYYGNETTAKTTNAKFKILYPRVLTKLVYNKPYWKVQVGNYKTKLEADRSNLIFKKEFSGTIVVPMRK